MFKRRRPEPAQELQRDHCSRWRQAGQDPFLITPACSGVEVNGVARRISPVLTAIPNIRDCDDDTTRRPDKGPACFIADEHSHFASALSRRMERYVAELAERARENEAPSLGEALSMCTPQAENQSGHDSLSLAAGRTGSKSAPRRQAASPSSEWLAHRTRAIASTPKETTTDESAMLLNRRGSDDNTNSSTSSHTISSWEPSAHPPRTAHSVPHRRQQQGLNQLLSARKASSPRSQNPAALLLGAGRRTSQTGRRIKEESCAQALAAIPTAKVERLRVPSFATSSSSTS